MILHTVFSTGLEACVGTPLFSLLTSQHVSPLSMKPVRKHFDFVNIGCLVCSEASRVALSKAYRYKSSVFIALEENPNILHSILPMSSLSCRGCFIPQTRTTHFKSLILPSIDHEMFPSLSPSFDLSP